MRKPPLYISLGEGNGNPLQCSCLENPRDRGDWWAAVSGVTQSRTRLKRLSGSSSSNRQGIPGLESLNNSPVWWTLAHSAHPVFSTFPRPMLPSWSRITYYPYELLGHFETGWDLEHRTFCSSACIWTDISSSNKIERNYKGLKITVCTSN